MAPRERKPRGSTAREKKKPGPKPYPSEEILRWQNTYVYTPAELTIAQLATFPNAPPKGTLEKWCASLGWVDRRREFWKEVTELAGQKLAEKEASAHAKSVHRKRVLASAMQTVAAKGLAHKEQKPEELSVFEVTNLARTSLVLEAATEEKISRDSIKRAWEDNMSMIAMDLIEGLMEVGIDEAARARAYRVVSGKWRQRNFDFPE